MEPFEVTDVFPLNTSPEEDRLGFREVAISLSGFGPGNTETLLRVVARKLSDSDISLKMLFNGQTRYRLLRYGYPKRLGFRLPGTKTKWHTLKNDLCERPEDDASGIESNIVPVPCGL